MRARAGRRLWAKADAPHKEADDLLVVLDAGAWVLELSFASAGAAFGCGRESTLVLEPLRALARFWIA